MRRPERVVLVKGCGGMADGAAARGVEVGRLKLLSWSVLLRV
jgi:hypothetical protein